MALSRIAQRPRDGRAGARFGLHQRHERRCASFALEFDNGPVFVESTFSIRRPAVPCCFACLEHPKSRSRSSTFVCYACSFLCFLRGCPRPCVLVAVRTADLVDFACLGCLLVCSTSRCVTSSVQSACSWRIRARRSRWASSPRPRCATPCSSRLIFSSTAFRVAVLVPCTPFACATPMPFHRCVSRSRFCAAPLPPVRRCLCHGAHVWRVLSSVLTSCFVSRPLHAVAGPRAPVAVDRAAAGGRASTCSTATEVRSLGPLFWLWS